MKYVHNPNQNLTNSDESTHTFIYSPFFQQTLNSFTINNANSHAYAFTITTQSVLKSLSSVFCLPLGIQCCFFSPSFWIPFRLDIPTLSLVASIWRLSLSLSLSLSQFNNRVLHYVCVCVRLYLRHFSAIISIDWATSKSLSCLVMWLELVFHFNLKWRERERERESFQTLVNGNDQSLLPFLLLSLIKCKPFFTF